MPGPGTGSAQEGTTQPAFTREAPVPVPPASTTVTSAPARLR